MKYSIFLKTVALLLAACCLLVAAACAVGIYAFSELELYGSGYASYLEQKQEARAENLANALARSYANKTLGNVPKAVAESYGYISNKNILSDWYGLNSQQWNYVIYDTFHNRLETASYPNRTEEYRCYEFCVESSYLVATTEEQAHIAYGDDTGNVQFYRWIDGPVYWVEIYMADTALATAGDIPLEYIQWAEAWRYGIIALLVGALFLGMVCSIYLCCAAGRTSKSREICPGGLNRLPLDLYAAAVFFADVGLVFLVVECMLPVCITEGNYLNPGMISLTALVILAGILLVLGWLFAVVAQIKAKKFYWWHHSVVGWILDKIWRGIRAVFRFLRRSIARLYRLLPLAGQRILTVAAWLFFVFICLLVIFNAHSFFGVLALFALIFWSAALFIYDIYCFGTVMQGAKRIAEGDLTTKISTRFLLGSYKDHANRLNTMADVATVAAKKQMQSERMKAELITNVSHDIKTPLTSIINYADLLQKPHTEEEGQQYLEVLSRQSLRMKKLLEDLMEMSKASTGNIAVEITRINGVETVNQALGEFSDKLAAAQLTPVFKTPEEPVYLQADGRLTWRVLSNLLSNTVKYALPGTRVYLELTQTPGNVLLSLKNISREELNVTAEELTERFVRGDASRNTEGSGLGLNIAKSLMELQHGDLSVTVDGDLFKVTLRFPAM